MTEQSAHLTLKIDTEQPIELRDFVGAFTSLANEFERFVKNNYPDAKSEPKMFIRKVRQGCIEADMVTGLVALSIAHMDQLLILENFVKLWGKRFSLLRDNSASDEELSTNSELKDWADAARSIASDPIAAHRLESATYHDGKREVTAEYRFTAPEARTALTNIEDRKLALAAPNSLSHSRVLMTYTRTDVHDATLNKKSGERVLIPSISDLERPIMYGSEIAENQIREHIREADENVYKRGFVVDIFEQKQGDRFIAYSVTNFHNIIEID